MDKKYLRVLLPILITTLYAGLPFVLARAQETDASINTTIDANARVNSTSVDTNANVQVRPRPQFLPKMGPAVSNITSGTRDTFKTTASTTREAVQKRVDAIQTVVLDHKEALRQTMLESRANAQMRAEGAKQAAQARYGERVQRAVKHIVERLSATVNRLSDIATRIESRIVKFQEAGYDMSEASRLLEDAKLEIATASEKVATLSSLIEEALSSAAPRERLSDIRAGVADVKEALRTAKGALMEVVVSIRTEVSAGTDATITQ